MRSLSSCILAAFFSLIFAHAAETSVRNGVVTDDTIVYRSPNASSEPLGRYRKGATLKVYYPDRNGWYATYFATPIKGSVYGWLKSDALEIQEGPRSTRSISFTGGFAFINPAEVQSALSVASAGVKVLDLALTYSERFGAKWLGWLRGGMLSYSTPSNSPSGASVTYSASSDYLILGGSCALMENASNLLTADLGVGLGIASGGNTNGTQLISTSSITTFPMLAKLSFRRTFFGSFGLGAEAGYRVESLGQVPVLYQPAGVAQLNANMNLSGPFAGASIHYLF